MSGPVRHVRQTVSLPYRWSYGKNLSRFFVALRDEKRFLGRRCPTCKAVHVPPVEVCGRCFARCEPDWIEVGPRGKLHSYTTVCLPFPGQPTEPPYTFAMITLDGTDTNFTHRVAEAEDHELAIGLVVEPVWNPTRRGNLHDVLYFRPVREAAAEAPAPPPEPAKAEEKNEMSPTVDDVFQAMPTKFQAGAAGDWTTKIQFEVSGEGGGDWAVEIVSGKCQTRKGKVEDPKATVTVSAETWIGLVTGKVNPQTAFLTGKIKIKGNMQDVLKISNPKIFPKD
mgnify:CR=1 FL=1